MNNEEWTEVTSKRTKYSNRKIEKYINEMKQGFKNKKLSCEIIQLPKKVHDNKIFEIVGKIIGSQGTHIKEMIKETNVENIYYEKKINSFVIVVNDVTFNGLEKAKEILKNKFNDYIKEVQ